MISNNIFYRAKQNQKEGIGKATEEKIHDEKEEQKAQESRGGSIADADFQ